MSKYAIENWDSFTRAYIEAMLFAANRNETENDDRSLEQAGLDYNDFAPQTIAKIVDECAQFQRENAADLVDYPDENAGHDFYFTRGGHGVGFWEKDYGSDDPATRAIQCQHLTEACEKFRGADVYVGDDGLIYQMGAENYAP